MHDTVNDFMRLFLSIGWGVSAWKLITVKGSSASAAVLRYYGAAVAISWTVYYTAFNGFSHAGLSVGWHNEISRVLSYATMFVFLVWAFLAHSLCREPVPNDVPSDD